MHACMHACMYVCTHECMYVCVYVCTYICICIYAWYKFCVDKDNIGGPFQALNSLLHSAQRMFL